MNITTIDGSMYTSTRPPSRPGVYVFLARTEDRIMYVGMAHDLEKVLYRYRKLDGRQKMRDRAKAGQIDRVAWVTCESGATPPSLEQLAIRRYRPPWNTQHNPHPRQENEAVPFTREEQRWLYIATTSLDRLLAELLRSTPGPIPSPPLRKQRSRRMAGVMALLLGTFGIHRFYLGQIGLGVLYFVFFWTLIPTILGIIDGIRLIAMSDAAFKSRYTWTR